MKLVFSYCLFLLSISFSNNAFTQLKLSASSGFFTQNFRWSVAGNYAGQNPNIYSELIWKKVNGLVVNFGVGYRVFNRIILSGTYQYAEIRSGTVTDADYKTDNRTDRSYYAEFSSGISSLMLSRLSAGYVFIENKRFSWNASFGYGYQRENLNIRPGKEDSSVITTGLNSLYGVKLYGPHSSTQLMVDLTDKVSIGLLVRFQLINYDASANWNLATNFQHPLSFQQLATGYQFNNELSVGYMLKKGLKFFISFENDHLKTSGGDDALYKSSGDVLISHFNGAKGKMVYALIGISYNK